MKKDFNISDRLKALRAVSKLTQEEFAEYSGISYKFYQHIEAGRKKLVRIDTISRICTAYGIEIWQFFYPKLPKLNIQIRRNVTSSPHNARKKRDKK